ncbi:MAG: AAA family ATPase [Patescibacteria group bacterium]|nr:AAA family ATPase [Patescibacteria group bacterium]MCL5431882.1 AAA family ATPase [Patescibacteria group bacterium]
MKQFLLILRGGPSSGKTSISNLISERVAKVARIRVDSLIACLLPQAYSVSDWIEVRPLGHEMARNLAKLLLHQGYNVIIEEMFPEHEFITKLVQIGEQEAQKVLVVELTVDLNEALRREEVRGDINIDRRGEIEKLINTIAANSYPDSLRIDSAKKRIEEISEQIINNLKS